MKGKTITKWISILFVFFVTQSVFANLPYFPIQFPRDEAAHFDNVPYPVGTMDEWWYYNGKVTATDGHLFGYYISYYYLELHLAGVPITVPMLQFRITDIDNQKVYDNDVVMPMNQVDMSTKTLSITMGKGNTLLKEASGDYVLQGSLVSKEGAAVSYSLRLTPTLPPLLIGENGLVNMWDNTNSYYYSVTHMKTTGYLQIDNQRFDLNPSQSVSWMDHQWGDFIISPLNQWYWSSIQLQNGLAINFGSILNPGNGQVPSLNATIQLPDGSKLFTHNIIFKPVTPSSGGFPQAEEIDFPDLNLSLMLQSLAPHQDDGGLSEGVGSAIGTYQGKPIEGYAYLETTVKFK